MTEVENRVALLVECKRKRQVTRNGVAYDYTYLNHRGAHFDLLREPLHTRAEIEVAEDDLWRNEAVVSLHIVRVEPQPGEVNVYVTRGHAEEGLVYVNQALVYSAELEQCLAMAKLLRRHPESAALLLRGGSLPGLALDHPVRALSVSQARALADWMGHYPHNWIMELGEAWMRAGAGTAYYTPKLQQIRNSFGGELLEKITSSDVLALIAAPRSEFRAAN